MVVFIVVVVAGTRLWTLIRYYGFCAIGDCLIGLFVKGFAEGAIGLEDQLELIESVQSIGIKSIELVDLN